MKRILVPVDFSDASQKALEHAAELARAFGATIDILHVWEPPRYLPPELVIAGPSPQQTLAELTRARAEAELNELVQKAGTIAPLIGQVRNEEGIPAAKIVEVARAGYDLIVMGSHGRSGFRHLLLGSVAERVVRHAKTRVLTIRVPEQQRPPSPPQIR
jgi:nucleotide-binding universal stress UspA family protein